MAQPGSRRNSPEAAICSRLSGSRRISPARACTPAKSQKTVAAGFIRRGDAGPSYDPPDAAAARFQARITIQRQIS